jgi:hypothetical protein
VSEGFGNDLSQALGSKRLPATHSFPWVRLETNGVETNGAAGRATVLFVTANVSFCLISNKALNGYLNIAGRRSKIKREAVASEALQAP